MSILSLIQLIATVIGAANDLSQIVTDLHAQGLTAHDQIPDEHLVKIKEALKAVDPSYEWDENHFGN